MIEYDTAEYASQRLTDTFIRNPEKKLGRVIAVLGRRGSDNHQVHMDLIDNVDGQISVYNIKDCDLSPLPLGNILVQDKRIYTARIPMRSDWRQGTRLRSLANIGGGLHHNVNRKVVWKSIQNCIDWKYPKLFEAIEMVEDMFSSSPITRKFSVDDKGRLIYKMDEVVGTCEQEPKLDNNHVWLSELLEEEMKHVV